MSAVRPAGDPDSSMSTVAETPGPTADPGAEEDELFLAGVLDAARGATRALVVIHTPKTAGTALAETARAAGWRVRTHIGLLASRAGCPQCGPQRCALARDWGAPTSGRVPGLHVDIEHRPVDLALATAARLEGAGLDVHVVMTVRDPVERLRSLFRWYWRDAFAGHVAPLARAAGTGARRAVAIRVATTLPGPLRCVGTRDHAGRLRRLRALDGLHYLEHRRGGPFIDGRLWLRALERHGVGPGMRFWLDEFGAEPERLAALRDRSRIALVTPGRLDGITTAVHGRPSVRANVSSDARIGPVEVALERMQDALIDLAERDAPYAELIHAAQG